MYLLSYLTNVVMMTGNERKRNGMASKRKEGRMKSVGEIKFRKQENPEIPFTTDTTLPAPIF